MNSNTNSNTDNSKGAIREKIKSIAEKREVLVQLLELPLGDLRLDVSQALEELDELLQQLNETFS
ncbi:MAG: hypothetical protein NZ901_11130 [Geminocystis sp.]|nr:hypothetical protein [Geminocystis sp.]HIK36820.1 hypothetical protein [Geminocystis sp. M7585_C2015_104]MCS7148725.1 hypothetical protein [Geminocystis sp.]MCX8078401.1 hypothetical protein [Geminocystis sp.]MDW8116126.1 hypothetical protein [Geminocystis sp.]